MSGTVFITLDGIDGAGKSTQIDRLCAWLEESGRRVIRLRDPGSTETGEAIRSVLLDSDLEMHRRTEALLYMAARCQLVEEKVRPALAADCTVVCDRFLLANVVYQSAEEHVPADLLWQLGELALGGTRPDLTILLDLPAPTALARLRGPADRMERRGENYLERVRQAFLRELPRAGGATAVVDAAASPRDVQQAIRDAVARHLEVAQG